MKSSLTIVLFCFAVLFQGCAAVVATGVVAGAATGISTAYDRRTFGTVIDDQSIELKASATLRNDEVLHDSAHINVTSYNGMVLLTGETPNQELKKRATELIQPIPNIKQIYNELDILAPSSLVSRSNDSWITTKVKTKIAAEKGVNPTRVKVVTERGTVYLMGLVTAREAELATTIARHTQGVQRVVKIFEYLPETDLE
ncbi:division/outer membrane stress-associated lipid-binding lipoprotein [Nitrosococcus wardiae]|uniref:Divisome-associated lipoprotein YraP n=1 Tax=Nitrosococcus wardiae TaxID=1814290 RepID=A0A4P7BWG4_9GAMM|nr:division/outer membrane stress-associated lipid-binding lipoprotein [Nitrosococcus wardiae]QBQ53430.1 divisome-associated lipoprotein YraP [Nitrosococcus wardiae]